MARKKNLSLDDSTAELLDKVGNVSAYLSHVIDQRWRAWTDALATLRAAGWKAPEMLAACDALNGYWLVGHGRAPSFVAMELADAASLSGLCEKWDVPPPRWSERLKAVAESPELAHALVTLVEEFWAGNEACEAAIRRG